MFKVVKDQLKISEGWVRCGQCTEVFDSNLKLRELDLNSMNRSEAAVGQALLDEPVMSSHEPVAALGAGPAVPFFAAVEGENSEQQQSNHKPLLEPTCGNGPPEFSFVPSRQSVSVWDASLVRMGLVCVIFVFLLLLGGQLIFHERDRLASADPRAGELLKSMCQQLHCVVLPRRQIEAIVVDSSSFNRLRADTYELSFVIRNSADTELAKPALELTLTDIQDGPLLRRVLLPSELDSQSDVLNARGEWSGRYVVSVTSNRDNLGKGIAGYRIVAFYP